MKVALFKAFPDPYRQSMRVYADCLLESLRTIMHPGDAVIGFLPKFIPRASRPARYIAQYVGYQLIAPFAQGDVNHVIDHSFGHLVYSLDHRRTVVTFHDATVFKVADGTIQSNGISKKTIISLRYSMAAIQKSAAVIAVSEISRRDFIRLVDVDPEKVHVIYPGVVSTFRMLADREDLKACYGLKGQHILHIGHNLFYMNVEGVIKTLHHLVYRAGVDVKLIKVGTQFTNAQNRLVSDLQLQDRIVFLGQVAAEDLPAVYNCADILLYPVLYAGFGLPPVEAMACGTPVVCSDRGSLPEIVGDAALMADPEDHRQLAMHVASLLTDDALRDTYRAKGLKQAQLYSWEKTAREVLTIYRRIYEEQGPRDF